MVLASVVVVASASFIWYRAATPSVDRALVDDSVRQLTPPPARLIVCSGSMDAACAQRAADRIGTPVAWLDDPSGYELQWMFATADPVIPDEGVIATQYFLGPQDRGMFEVLTSVPPLPESAPPGASQAVFDGTHRGTMWLDERFGLASIVWTHDGVEYLITAQPRPWDPSAVVAAWRTIQYASPKTVS